jgi:histone-lysine N-methyltransferase ASH1L
LSLTGAHADVALKDRFVGDAAAYWKKTPHFGDSSKCVCKPEDGCAEDCQNRIMLYECDETNCNVGKAHCQNRAFQTLQERTKRGGRYRVGVEVYKTSDRGYGVRSNRCFEPNQIIMEYTGEIITEEECDRRMNEVYKNNEVSCPHAPSAAGAISNARWQCYYLMSFDQNMIIDATTGSIARFVNHSCSPNCRMIKWIVSGQPRMALFAG